MGRPGGVSQGKFGQFKTVDLEAGSLRKGLLRFSRYLISEVRERMKLITFVKAVKQPNRVETSGKYCPSLLFSTFMPDDRVTVTFCGIILVKDIGPFGDLRILARPR